LRLFLDAAAFAEPHAGRHLGRDALNVSRACTGRGLQFLTPLKFGYLFLLL
jgi:hypothetical protein